MLTVSLAVLLMLALLDVSAGLPSWTRPPLAFMTALGAYWTLDPGTPWGPTCIHALAAAGAGIALSQALDMMQAATDTMRVRVLSAATRRTRVPPL